MRKEFNSQRIFWVHQHGRHFIVFEHQYGRRDVMWKRSIVFTPNMTAWPRGCKPRIRKSLLIISYFA